MKKIKLILPITLGLFLPILNLFPKVEDLNISSHEVIIRWFSASLALFILWYLILLVSQIKTRYKYLLIVLSLSVFIGSIYLFMILIGFDISSHLKWMLLIKLSSASLLFIVIQYALKASGEISQLTLEKKQIESENYRVQLQELRSKVDPHFLFNSMNTLRTMVRNEHPQSEEFIMSLSAFYRQTLKSNNSSTIQLEEEIKILKSYLFLMQMRNEGKVEVDIDIDEKWNDLEIPTMSLQIVTENCFKHNQTSSTSPLQIIIKSDEEGYISIKNNLQSKFSKSEISGYGLENIRKRYHLLGVEKGVLVQQTSSFFEVKLKLI